MSWAALTDDSKARQPLSSGPEPCRTWGRPRSGRALQPGPAESWPGMLCREASPCLQSFSQRWRGTPHAAQGGGLGTEYRVHYPHFRSCRRSSSRDNSRRHRPQATGVLSALEPDHAPSATAPSLTFPVSRAAWSCARTLDEGKDDTGRVLDTLIPPTRGPPDKCCRMWDRPGPLFRPSARDSVPCRAVVAAQDLPQPYRST